jgi:hypothetical protein
LKFDLDELGRPVNIRVVQSVPAGMFDDVSRKGLSEFRYCRDVAKKKDIQIIFTFRRH